MIYRDVMMRPDSSKINRIRQVLEDTITYADRFVDSEKAKEALETYNLLIEYIHHLEGPLDDCKVNQVDVDACMALSQFYNETPSNE